MIRSWLVNCGDEQKVCEVCALLQFRGFFYKSYVIVFQKGKAFRNWEQKVLGNFCLEPVCKQKVKDTQERLQM